VVDNTDLRGTEGRGGGQSIRDLIERTFLIGVGAAAFTIDRVQELIDEFVRRGELSSEEGREMVDRILNRSRSEARSAMRRYDSSVQGALRDFGIAGRREFEDLEMRLRQLEHRVGLLEATSEAPGSEPSEPDTAPTE
jgi:polyhydroxyalkanoate synthesis regulator phasin